MCKVVRRCVYVIRRRKREEKKKEEMDGLEMVNGDGGEFGSGEVEEIMAVVQETRRKVS